MDYKDLANRLRSIYLDDMFGILHNPPDVYKDCNQAATAINDLLNRLKAAEARADGAEKMLAAAVSDLLRAEKAAEETNDLLDDEVHPSCDYSLYLAVHDSVSDIVNWERDDVWRGPKEG